MIISFFQGLKIIKKLTSGCPTAHHPSKEKLEREQKQQFRAQTMLWSMLWVRGEHPRPNPPPELAPPWCPHTFHWVRWSFASHLTGDVAWCLQVSTNFLPIVGILLCDFLIVCMCTICIKWSFFCLRSLCITFLISIYNYLPQAARPDFLSIGLINLSLIIMFQIP